VSGHLKEDESYFVGYLMPLYANKANIFNASKKIKKTLKRALKGINTLFLVYI